MATATAVLDALEPRSFWGHFGALTKIPRPSRHEEPVIEHVRAWASHRGYELEQDSGRNLVIRVPATPGRESAPVLILQGHLDMVCERDSASPNDPAEGRIVVVRDGDWLTADGTTLGADDGVAIAAMMALVEDESLPHGPLELLMTVAEEVGLEGANALDGSLITGSTHDQSRQRGGRRPDRRVRRQHRYVDPSRRAARCVRRGCGRAFGRRRRRAWWALRRRDPPRTGERDQGARPGAARGQRDRSLPARLTRRRQEPQRNSPRRRRSLLNPARPGECVSIGG